MQDKNQVPTRQEILQELSQVGREHSDATVLFHATMASLLDLHPTDYKALSMVERLGAMSAGEIAQHSGLAAASVTNLIDRLERKGFVRRVPDPQDRRRVMVKPVMDRVMAARGLFASTQRSLTQLYKHYSDQDLAVIVDFLKRNAERLRAETRKLDAASLDKEK
jgi:DNA-binding MarR family transcriptional regulator